MKHGSDCCGHGNGHGTPALAAAFEALWREVLGVRGAAAYGHSNDPGPKLAAAHWTRALPLLAELRARLAGEGAAEADSVLLCNALKALNECGDAVGLPSDRLGRPVTIAVPAAVAALVAERDRLRSELDAIPRDWRGDIKRAALAHSRALIAAERARDRAAGVAQEAIDHIGYAAADLYAHGHGDDAERHHRERGHLASVLAALESGTEPAPSSPAPAPDALAPSDPWTLLTDELKDRIRTGIELGDLGGSTTNQSGLRREWDSLGKRRLNDGPPMRVRVTATAFVSVAPDGAITREPQL